MLHEYDFEEMEKQMPDLEFLRIKCPHCTDEEGNFATIVLYIPKKDNSLGIATQCNCNGQEDRCTVSFTFMQTYNNERYLKALAEKESLD